MTAGRTTDTEALRYEGERAQTTTRVFQHRCRCGSLTPSELTVTVDVGEDPDVGLQATEQGVERGLHHLVCQACNTAQLAPVPFTYHDGEQRIFVLVLPEALRSGELEERAALLQALSKEAALIPDYVVEPEVVYGPEGLSDLLAGRTSERDEQRRDARRLRDVGQRLDEAAQREERILEREQELTALTDDLDGRSSQLTEKELGLRDRKGALDRRSQELERMTVALEEAKEQLRAESQGDLPEALRVDTTEALDINDILTSAPSPEGENAVPSVTMASGSAATNSPMALASVEALSNHGDAPILLTSETRIAPVQGQGIGKVRASSEMATGEHIEIHAAVPAATLSSSTVPDLGFAEPAHSIPSEIVASHSQPLAPQAEIGDHEITVPTTTGTEVQAWREAEGSHLKVLQSHEVSLVTSLRPSALEELLASDIRALLQLHRMPTYPLVSLTLARATTLAGQPGKPYSFHFDVGDEGDRAILSQLAEDFRFRLEIFDGEHNPVRQRRLAAPLAANVNYVVALASDARKELAPHSRDFAQAIKAFDSSRYDRLGRGHRLARDFKDSLLDLVENPTSLLGAIAQCGRFSAPPGEEYLVAIRSYPFERWHQRRLQVIKKALAYGLWMGPDLARVAVSEELVRSRRDLISQCQKNFQVLVDSPDTKLSDSSIRANWASLAVEGEALGMTPAKKRRAPSPIEIGSEERRLLAQLEDPDGRLQAIVALCQMKSISGMDPVFRVLAELQVDQAAEAFAAITLMGNQAAESLLVLLSCPAAHLRHGAALALCELGNEEGIDSTCESLMSSEGTIWREYAVALGRVGSSAVMPLVARIATSGKRGQARAVWALGYIALNGASKPVETLAAGRDKAVSQVASASLELRGRLQTNTVKVERAPSEQHFTDSFVRAIAGESLGYASADLSGPSMLLDETDLIEAT